MPDGIPRAYILSQGEELLAGLTVDTNATFLAEQLTDMGLRVWGMATAGDRVEDIAEALRSASQQASVVICTGGLGPTVDDLTAEGTCQAFGMELQFNEEAMGQVEARFEALGRPIPTSNRRQAMLPSGCNLVLNPLGTAPGFAVELPSGCSLWFLPGVPSEMRRMWADTIRPDLEKRYARQPSLRHLFRVLGRGESQLQDLLEDFPKRFSEVELSFRARMPEIQVKLLTSPKNEGNFHLAVEEVRKRIGRDCFSERDDNNLAKVIGRMLVDRGEKLALAESCTGGLVGHLCVTEPGSSAWLDRGFVTYSNQSKTAMLGVREKTLGAHGAVSEEVVREMATGARSRAGTDWALAVTGIAGPTGASPEKPVGTTWLAVDGPIGTYSRKIRLGRDRSSNRSWSALIVLDMLRRQLLRAGQ